MRAQYFMSKRNILQLPDCMKEERYVFSIDEAKLTQPKFMQKLDPIFSEVNIDTSITTMSTATPNHIRAHSFLNIIKDKKIRKIDNLTPKFRSCVSYVILGDNGNEITGGTRFTFVNPEIISILTKISRSNKLSYIKQILFDGAIRFDLSDEIPFELKFRHEFHGYKIQIKDIVIEGYIQSETEQMSTSYKSQTQRIHKDMTTKEGYITIFSLKKMFPDFQDTYDVDGKYRKVSFTFNIKLDNLVEIYDDTEIQSILAENNIKLIPPVTDDEEPEIPSEEEDDPSDMEP